MLMITNLDKHFVCNVIWQVLEKTGTFDNLSDIRNATLRNTQIEVDYNMVLI